MSWGLYGMPQKHGVGGIRLRWVLAQPSRDRFREGCEGRWRLTVCSGDGKRQEGQQEPRCVSVKYPGVCRGSYKLFGIREAQA